MTSHLKKAFISLALALAFLLAACGKDNSSLSASATSLPEDASASASSPSGAEASAPSALSGSGVSSAVESAAPALPVLDQLPLGTFAYIDTEGLFPDERAPQLELLGDNRAAFRVNTGNEVGMVQGSAAFKGSELTLYIESSDIETEFWGSNSGSLTFRVLDADRLEYTGGPFGLTQRQMVFARQDSTAGSALMQGTGTAPAPVEADPAAMPGSTAPVASDSPSAPSAAPDASGDDSEAASEPEADVKVPVIEPDKAPPETLKKGDSIRLAGMDPESLVYDAAYFDAARGPDGASASVTLTALLEGDTTLGYTTTEGEFAGQARQFSISIVERGVKLWLVVAIAAGAALAGGAGAIFAYLTLKKRRDNKEERLAAAAEKKAQQATAARQKKEERLERTQEKQVEKEEAAMRREAKKAKKEEQAATKRAKAKDKKALKAAKKAAAAAEEAKRAAEKVSAAADKHSDLTGKADKSRDASGDDKS